MISEIDFSKVVPSQVLAAMHPASVDSLISMVMDAAKVEWDRLASVELFTSRHEYREHISNVEYGDGFAAIHLTGEIPNIVENGLDPIDLRKILLGPKVPVVPRGQKGKHVSVHVDEYGSAKTGYYRAIPFRHTVGTSGVLGAPMGAAFRKKLGPKDAAELGQKVWEHAKELTGTRTDPYKGTKWGGRLPAGLAPLLKPHHKTDIFAGMVKSRKKYQKKTQSQYFTFRTISTHNKIGWMRPKIEGRHLSKKVAAYVERYLGDMVESFMEGSR